MIGIYKIENLINHKIYVGQSVHIERRWKEHCFPSTNSLISNAIKKYGKENFSFQILEECSEEELDNKEISYIKQFDCITPKGYNIKDYVDGKETTFLCYDKETFLNIVNDIKESLLTFQEISEKYDITKRLVYYINNGEVHQIENEKYPLREIKDFSKKTHHCSCCGKEISRWGTMCKECLYFSQRKTERPSRELLKELIRSETFTNIAKQYKVSDTTIKKWCKNYNLPSKKSDIKKMNDSEWSSI